MGYLEKSHTNETDAPQTSKGTLLIHLRWVAFFGALFVVAVAFYFKGAVPSILGPLGSIAIILGVTNGLFHFLFHSGLKIDSPVRRSQFHLILFFVQIVVDYVCVTLLIYYFGFGDFNLAVLFLPHVVLASILCEKQKYSFAVMGLSLLLILGLVVRHWVHIEIRFFGIVEKEFVHFAPVMFWSFNAVLFLFVAYLTSILTKQLVTQKNELLEMNKRLIEVDREKQAYTLRATHELKAPFAAIVSYINVILDGYVGEVTPKMKDVLVKMLNRSSSLSVLIKNIIQLSNLRTTLFFKSDLKPTPLNKLIRARIGTYENTASSQKKRIVFQTEFVDDFVYPVIPNMFEILLDNLVLNGLRYSTPEQEVYVSLCKSEKPHNVRLEVRDFGIGILPEDMERIFEERFRSENAVAMYPGGNGMGLAIVDEVAKLHQGELQAKSILEKGSVISFEF